MVSAVSSSWLRSVKNAVDGQIGKVSGTSGETGHGIIASEKVSTAGEAPYNTARGISTFEPVASVLGGRVHVNEELATRGEFYLVKYQGKTLAVRLNNKSDLEVYELPR